MTAHCQLFTTAGKECPKAATWRFSPPAATGDQPRTLVLCPKHLLLLNESARPWLAPLYPNKEG